MRRVRFEPDGSLKFQVYLPPEIARAFAEMAIADDRDLSQLARYLIRKGLPDGGIERAKKVQVPKEIYVKGSTADPTVDRRKIA